MGLKPISAASINFIDQTNDAIHYTTPPTSTFSFLYLDLLSLGSRHLSVGCIVAKLQQRCRRIVSQTAICLLSRCRSSVCRLPFLPIVYSDF